MKLQKKLFNPQIVSWGIGDPGAFCQYAYFHITFCTVQFPLQFLFYCDVVLEGSVALDAQSRKHKMFWQNLRDCKPTGI